MADISIATPSITVALRPLGASIASILVRDKDGVERDVVLGFPTEAAQRDSPTHPYVGTVGRVANRIANARFSLNETKYELIANNGPNCLHGGVNGFDSKVWTVESKTASQVVFSLESEDGEEGFPVAVKSTVTYTVEDSSVKINYSVTPIQEEGDSRLTVVNLTTHSYFNLSGFEKGSMLEHVASFPSALGHLETTDTQIPTGKLIETGAAPEMDFTTAPKTFGQDLQLVQEFRGYDHFYVVKPFSKQAEKDVRLAAVVHSVETGIVMEMLTDAVGFQLYTGNWLDGTIPLKTDASRSYEAYSGFCLEASAPPDAINSTDASVRDTVTVGNGKDWNQVTVYRFGVKE
ncbi:hypothetical protein HDU77_009938 [Chytriomyces hyalinus]|nr:hypothetical protein HDU77_009938 [Chytriomyces hyalinus]